MYFCRALYVGTWVAGGPVRLVAVQHGIYAPLFLHSSTTSRDGPQLCTCLLYAPMKSQPMGCVIDNDERFSLF
jgi:hypothetical protein